MKGGSYPISHKKSMVLMQQRKWEKLGQADTRLRFLLLTLPQVNERMIHPTMGEIPWGNSWHLQWDSLRIRCIWELENFIKCRDIMYEVLPFTRNYIWPPAVWTMRINGISLSPIPWFTTSTTRKGTPAI